MTGLRPTKEHFGFNPRISEAASYSARPLAHVGVIMVMTWREIFPTTCNWRICLGLSSCPPYLVGSNAVINHDFRKPSFAKLWFNIVSESSIKGILLVNAFLPSGWVDPHWKIFIDVQNDCFAHFGFAITICHISLCVEHVNPTASLTSVADFQTGFAACL